jgi:hypothetical protein
MVAVSRRSATTSAADWGTSLSTLRGPRASERRLSESDGGDEPLFLAPDGTQPAAARHIQRWLARISRDTGLRFESTSADLIVRTTNGYPAHLQLLADHAWRLAESVSHTITVHDARHALRSAAGEVEERTLGPATGAPHRQARPSCWRRSLSTAAPPGPRTSPSRLRVRRRRPVPARGTR